MRRYSTVLISYSALLIAAVGAPARTAHSSSSAVTMADSPWIFFQSGVIGWQFTVKQPVIVTALGQFTAGSAIAVANVGIYDSNASLLTSATIQAIGVNVVYEDQFRFLPVREAVLVPGTIYTAASATRGLSALATPVASRAIPVATNFHVDPVITTLGARLGQSSSFNILSMPTDGAGDPSLADALYLGPNFKFDVIPEPTTAALMLLGLSILSYARPSGH